MPDTSQNEEATTGETEKVEEPTPQDNASITKEKDEAAVEEKTDEKEATTEEHLTEKAAEDTTPVAAETTTVANPVEDEPASTEDKNEKKEEERPAKDAETETDASVDSIVEEKPEDTVTPIVSASKKSRPPYKYDPSKITLRFLFANRDGLTVTVECLPSDTVGEVKGALISVWPESIATCDGGESIRLICMGKGYLMPDTRTLEDCQIPVFKTHPTPINVSVKPKLETAHEVKHKKSHDRDGGSSGNRSSSDPSSNTAQATQGCPCTIL